MSRNRFLFSLVQMQNEISYPYPKGTPAADGKDGTYYWKLNEKNTATLKRLLCWSQESSIQLQKLSASSLSPELLLLRYLRANNFDFEKAKAHIIKNLEWRKEMKVDLLVLEKPEVLLGCTLEELTAVFPHWHSGYDKTGRPVVYQQYGKFDAARVKALGKGSFDRLIRYHIWKQEACSRLCFKQSHDRKELVETVTGVVDIKNMTLSQITSDFMKMVQSMAQIDQQQYPETLGRMFIINAPSAFPFVWRMVKPWLDPVVTAKIHIFGAKDWQAPMIDFIGVDNLPENYGGTQPALNPGVHPFAETMREYGDSTAASAGDDVKKAELQLSSQDSETAANTEGRVFDYRTSFSEPPPPSSLGKTASTSDLPLSTPVKEAAIGCAVAEPATVSGARALLRQLAKTLKWSFVFLGLLFALKTCFDAKLHVTMKLMVTGIVLTVAAAVHQRFRLSCSLRKLAFMITTCEWHC